MRDRPLRGTTEWRPAEIVLDVPEQATAFGFGVLLSGAGAVETTHLTFEQAHDHTLVIKDTLLPEEPQNLDFSRAT